MSRDGDDVSGQLVSADPVQDARVDSVGVALL